MRALIAGASGVLGTFWVYQMIEEVTALRIAGLVVCAVCLGVAITNDK